MIITPDQFRLTACGAPEPPRGARYVVLPHVLVFTYQLAALQVATDLQQPVPAEYDFLLRAVSCKPQSTNEQQILYRFARPDGRYFANARQPILRTLGWGSYRKLISPQQYFPAGSKIAIELEETQSAIVPTTITFEGGIIRYVE